MMAALLCGSTWITARIRRWAEKPEPPRAPALCETHELHVIDYNRSSIMVTDTGNVYAHCCVSGCRATFLMGRNLAEAMVGEHVRAEMGE